MRKAYLLEKIDKEFFNEEGQVAIRYEEILKNWNDDTWRGWIALEYIESTVGELRNKVDRYGNPFSWKYHISNFVNNYLLEKKVREMFGLSYITNDHESLIEGKGHDIPDFVDCIGTRYELKNSQKRSFLNTTYWNWHGAQVKLWYIREEGILCVVDYCADGKWHVMQELAKFRPERIYANE